ncbi:MAG: threonine synthase [Microthrixaceae bacterium]
MRYLSTRSAAAELPFADVLLEGLATDGGLYVPDHWPSLPERAVLATDSPGSGTSVGYVDTAIEVMWPFVSGSIERGPFEAMVADAYATFEPPSGTAPDVVPVRRLHDNLWMAELFWGPTLAFKDIALQLVGRLFDYELSRRGTRTTIVGATSGDTGSAAIEACRDRHNLDIVILHPEGRTSEVQRRQMTTVLSPNVHNVAVAGTFDDCQDLVKALFADEVFRREMSLSAVNSINWARVMAQIVYYVTSVREINRRLGRGSDAPVDVCVPTGNFGNIFAGYGAMRMGVPIGRLVVASNSNDILTRFFTTGTMDVREVHPTLSPSMDIQVSSNLERLLFEMNGRDGVAVAEMMTEFRNEGRVSVELDSLTWLGERFEAGRIDDDECLAVMSRVHADLGVTVDPHTAVALGVGERFATDPTVPLLCLATAHPAKFPDAVAAATGVRPRLPGHLADLLDRPERCDHLPVDVEALKVYVRGHRSAG